MVIAGVAALAAVAGGGAALAASHAFGGSDTRQAVINDAAGRLGVTPSALTGALQQAAIDQVEAAVKAGTLSRKQADAIEARIKAGRGLGPGGLGGGMHRGGFGFGFGMGLRNSIQAASSYLGLTPAQIKTQLEAGKTLADIAKDQGKTADGLVKAIVDAQTAALDKAVQDGKLTATQEQQIESKLTQVVTDLVNGTFPKPQPGMLPKLGPGGGFHWGGGPPQNGFRQGYFRHSAARSTPKTAL
jgi:hypothetical protein